LSKAFNFEEWVKNRLSHRRNVLGAFVGETGVGKSYMALRIAEKFDKNFSVDNVVFDYDEFLDRVDSVKSGSFIVFDEAGVGFSHRTFMSLTNKVIGYILQSFRFKLINVLFTLPSLGYMDYVGRSLIHFYVKVEKPGFGKIYKIWVDRFEGKIGRRLVGILETDLPSEDLCSAYEAKKEGFFEKGFI
jgi:hypothetical protein